MILPIYQFGEESLRSLSIEVDKKEIRSKSFKKLIRDMLETMYKLEGVGLAAPQVGVNKRLIVLDTNWFDGEPKPLILINPEIVYKDGELMSEEGCLSFKGSSMKKTGVQLNKVKRFKKVKVNYTDLDNKKQSIEADGNLLSRCLQHEIDHLDGILFIDRDTDLDEVIKQLVNNGFESSLKKEKPDIELNNLENVSSLS
jgi:peptide deformylase